MSLQAEDTEENSETENGGHRQGSARAVGWCFPQDDFRILWPGFLLQAAQEGDGMANVGVPCQSLSPHGTSDPGRSLGVGGGDRSVTRVPGGRGFWRWFIALAGGFWWRGSEAGDLWKSTHLSWCPLKAPEEQLCPGACAVVAAGFWGFPRFGCPSVKHEMETSGNPAGMPGTISWGGAAPSHPTSITPRRGRAAVAPSPALRQEPPEQAEPSSNGQRSPKTEFDGTAIPKRGSLARSSRRGSKPSSLLGESLALALGAAKKCP